MCNDILMLVKLLMIFYLQFVHLALLQEYKNQLLTKTNSHLKY